MSSGICRNIHGIGIYFIWWLTVAGSGCRGREHFVNRPDLQLAFSFVSFVTNTSVETLTLYCPTCCGLKSEEDLTRLPAVKLQRPLQRSRGPSGYSKRRKRSVEQRSLLYLHKLDGSLTAGLACLYAGSAPRHANRGGTTSVRVQLPSYLKGSGQRQWQEQGRVTAGASVVYIVCLPGHSSRHFAANCCYLRPATRPERVKKRIKCVLFYLCLSPSLSTSLPLYVLRDLRAQLSAY